MIAVQRHRQILETVLDRGAARVGELAATLGVTEETIRRDLRVLSDRGVLVRTHGGAVAVEGDDGRRDLPYASRDVINTPAKAAIARAAVGRLAGATVIGLDASSTACQLARLLPDEPMTVVTNSLVICGLLSGRRRIEVVCTGGTLDPEAMAFTGLHARRTLESFNIQVLFFSCRGIDLERGLSEANDRHASVKLGMIESSRTRVLLADSSKIGLASTVFVGPVGLADLVITEDTIDPAARERIARLASLVGGVERAALL